MLELKYTKGPAAFGSVKNLQKCTNLKQSKVKFFSDGKNTHTKHKKYRKRFPTLKVIAYDINKIWSLDLAHVDKLEREQRFKTFVGFGRLSLTLSTSGTLKINVRRKQSRGIKKMIKNKRPKEV